MHIESETAINARLVVLLLLVYKSSANILFDVPKNNPLNIDWDPAPSPEDGPPLSAGASRDKSLLPAQIGGILGAYLFSVCVVGLLLVFFGRRLRIKVQNSTRALDIEMVETAFPKTAAFDPSPVSPADPGGPRNFSWPSPEKDERNPYIFPSVNRSPTTPGIEDPYVDTRIVEADREMLQRDLEDIYAHVMEQEEAKANGVKLKDIPLPPQLQRVGPVPMDLPGRQPSPPKKIEKARPGTLNLDEAKPLKPHSRTASLISSLKSPRRKGIKGMRISSPIPTPVSATFPTHHNASDEEPLTPRYYTPPPPPPVPKDQVPYTHSRNTSSGDRSLAEQLSPYRSGPRHTTNPSQTSVQSTASKADPISATSTTSTTPFFLPPPPRQQQTPTISAPTKSTSTTTARALPFRSFEPALQSPSFVPTTKTTVLERNLPSTGPHTGGLKTPWSAGAVPYSPYQPFSPMMPITPRLVTKEERKAKKKQEGRTPILEMIRSEDEIWDSGY